MSNLPAVIGGEFPDATAEYFDRPEIGGGQILVAFPNGYGASIVRNAISYGGTSGLFELAVLHHGQLCYDTPVTDDVEGWLTPNQVIDLLHEINALEAQP